MGQGQSCEPLSIYSQNISCDSLSEKIIEIEGMEDMGFEERFKVLMKSLSKITKLVHVIAFNEIRHEDNVKLVLSSLQEAGYEARQFANNDSPMSFNNVLAVSKACPWNVVKWEQKWVAFDDKPYLHDEHSLIEGDKHGRCAGIVYLQNSKNPAKQVCVLVSHVIPFGEAKVKQQDSLFSINQTNLNLTPPTPTILVGDFNRFSEEDENFQERLKTYGLKEAKSSRLIIPIPAAKSKTYKNESDIGTFNPWPSDSNIYSEKLRQPLSSSRLDVQLCTNNGMVEVKDVYTRASMYKAPVESPNAAGEDINEVRRLLNCSMTSDHLAIIGEYAINPAKSKRSNSLEGQL